MKRYLCVLAAAIFMTVPASTSPQSSSREVASWTDVGIDPAEAKQWVAAGIPFAEWANQWKGEGFGPADAHVWATNKVNVYTAADFMKAGFGVGEATAWIGHGIRSALRAKQFRDGGFDAASAELWWRLGVYPEEAAAWKREGLSAPDAIEWHYGEKEYFYSGTWKGYSRPSYSIEWVRQWRSAGFTPAEARLAESYGVKFDDAVAWRRAGFGFDEAMTWHDAGFLPREAAREKAAGSTAVDAEERRREGADRPADYMASLHTDVTLKPDATVDVVETIVIHNGPGGSVDRCLPRRFTQTVVLRRSASSSQPGWPSYRFASVRQNGAPVAHTIQRSRGGDIAVCIGGNDSRLAEGVHTFEVRYTTTDRLVFLYDHDRLYFTVTDASPALSMTRASATVRLPAGANTVRADGFAGPPNRKYFTTDVRETDEGDVIAYTVTRPLRDDMQFAIAVSLPKGMATPGLWWRARRLDREYGRMLSSALLFVCGLGAAILYFVLAWRRVGRDPRRGAVVALYEPPGDLSPALMRYLSTRRRADARTIAATLVRLAQRGALLIREREGRYRIEQIDRPAGEHAPHESAFLERLFIGTGQLTLGTRDARRRLRAAAAALRKALRAERAGYIAPNTRHFWPGAALSVAGAVPALSVVDLSGLDAGAAYAAFLVAVVALVNLTFRALLKAPTEAARRLLDDIEGFRRFLEAAYRDGLAPSLPYAMALGIDSERASILSSPPKWYSGRSGGFSGADFIASLARKAPRMGEA